MTRTALLTAILATIAILLAGCGTDASPAATTQVSVTGTDSLDFEPDDFAVPAGEEITVDLTAGKAVEHDFTIEDAADVGTTGDDVCDEGHTIAPGDLAVAHADPGQTITGTFEIDEPGTYTLYCSVAGHRQSGMLGKLTVVATR